MENSGGGATSPSSLSSSSSSANSWIIDLTNVHIITHPAKTVGGEMMQDFAETETLTSQRAGLCEYFSADESKLAQCEFASVNAALPDYRRGSLVYITFDVCCS